MGVDGGGDAVRERHGFNLPCDSFFGGGGGVVGCYLLLVGVCV